MFAPDPAQTKVAKVDEPIC